LYLKNIYFGAVSIKTKGCKIEIYVKVAVMLHNIET
jgi:hypothetical protein